MVPVLAVVPAKILFSPGEIGNFVVDIAPVLQKLPGQQEKFPLGLFLRQAKFAPGQPPGQRRCRAGVSPAAMVN